jgi:hypothetical protein
LILGYHTTETKSNNLALKSVGVTETWINSVEVLLQQQDCIKRMENEMNFMLKFDQITKHKASWVWFNNRIALSIQQKLKWDSFVNHKICNGVQVESYFNKLSQPTLIYEVQSGHLRVNQH